MNNIAVNSLTFSGGFNHYLLVYISRMSLELPWRWKPSLSSHEYEMCYNRRGRWYHTVVVFGTGFEGPHWSFSGLSLIPGQFPLTPSQSVLRLVLGWCSFSLFSCCLTKVVFRAGVASDVIHQSSLPLRLDVSLGCTSRDLKMFNGLW